ncbi:MAG: DNA-processing protein DprA [Anaerolineae bacterium]|nr:DNA-processing protein DprA [Anaerolineae bacterium]
MSVTASTQIWTAGSTVYPQSRLSCLGAEAPAEIHVRGDDAILRQNTLALLCSAKAPAGILLAVHDLAQQWRLGQPGSGSQVIISGFHSPVEQEAFEILLRGPASVVYCPARSIPKRLPPAWQEALDDDRLTFLSPFADTVRRATKETAITRNRFIAALADAVFVAYAHPGSSTEQLVNEVLTWNKPVYTLPHDSNGHLHKKGVSTWQQHLEKNDHNG